ncbi:hypothetical protein [Xanthomonas axonopodis]
MIVNKALFAVCSIMLLNACKPEEAPVTPQPLLRTEQVVVDGLKVPGTSADAKALDVRDCTISETGYQLVCHSDKQRTFMGTEVRRTEIGLGMVDSFGGPESTTNIKAENANLEAMTYGAISMDIARNSDIDDALEKGGWYRCAGNEDICAELMRGNDNKSVWVNPKTNAYITINSNLNSDKLTLFSSRFQPRVMQIASNLQAKYESDHAGDQAKQDLIDSMKK